MIEFWIKPIQRTKRVTTLISNNNSDNVGLSFLVSVKIKKEKKNSKVILRQLVVSYNANKYAT